MKVLTWNVNRASISRSATWEKLEQEDADIVLLQEVTRIPDPILHHYHGNVHCLHPRYFAGHEAMFQTAILTKWEMNREPFLFSELEWVNRIQREQYGWILGCEVVDDTGTPYRVVSTHSPAFFIPRNHLEGVDLSGVKLENNSKLFLTEILWALLRDADLSNDTNWIVAGDFNSSIKFDRPKDRGNLEIANRMNALGLTDCLQYYCPEPVPTFQQPGGVVEHQLDYVYVSAPLLKRLNSARVPGCDEVFEPTPRLSDHLPIVCEFD